MSEMSRGWIKEVRMDASGNIASINDFMSGFVAPGDLEFGPDGSMYVLEYGTGFFSGSPADQARAHRLRHQRLGAGGPGRGRRHRGRRTLAVQFSSAGTADPDGDAVTFAWDLDGDGEHRLHRRPTRRATYDAVGDYTVLLTVTDCDRQVRHRAGRRHRRQHRARPSISSSPVDGGFFASGDDVAFDVDVQDAEETVDCGEVVVQEGLGHDIHVHPNLSRSTAARASIRTAASADHGPDANTYGVLIATYADGGANDGANAAAHRAATPSSCSPSSARPSTPPDRQGVGYTGYDDKSGTRPGGGGTHHRDGQRRLGDVRPR